jgi:hypothetical protein
MIELIVLVEDETEETFVNKVLASHMQDRGIFTKSTIVGKELARKRGHGERGGGHFNGWSADFNRILRGDRRVNLRVTSLFDLFRLPRDFPGLEELRQERDTNHRCDALQRAFAEAVNDRRFIPYIQRHEFEALVLAALPSLRGLLDAEDSLTGLDRLAGEIRGLAPEDVNDGPETAPSKRLQRRVPGYSKTLHGPLATEDAGLAALRQACPRFDGWVRQLEALGSST